MWNPPICSFRAASFLYSHVFMLESNFVIPTFITPYIFQTEGLHAWLITKWCWFDFRVCGWNPKLWLFKAKGLISTCFSVWCFLFWENGTFMLELSLWIKPNEQYSVEQSNEMRNVLVCKIFDMCFEYNGLQQNLTCVRSPEKYFVHSTNKIEEFPPRCSIAGHRRFKIPNVLTVW